MDADESRFGQFVLLEKLGQGTTGIIHKARDCLSGRLVSLKTLKAGTGSDVKAQVARLHREAQILANLASGSERNTPQLYQAGECQGQPYYCREFIDGETLEQAVKTGAVNLEEAIPIVVAVARTVARVHDRGIVHRNLTPDNVLVMPDKSVRLIGFGLAGPNHVQISRSGIAGDLKLLGEMLFWVCSQTESESSNKLDLIVQRCRLEPPNGGYENLSSLADDLESCMQNPT